jgi:hypothetical protein
VRDETVSPHSVLYLRRHHDGIHATNACHSEWEVELPACGLIPAMDVDSSSYLDDLWRATRSLFAAVLAIAPHKSGSNGDETREELFRLAGEIERMMPNQAAELRYLAR